MEVSAPWAGFIFDGSKLKEVRKGNGTWSHIKSGDILLINEKGNSASYKFLVVNATRYSSIEECLMTEGVENLLPGKKTIEEGLEIYLSFDGDSPEATKKRHEDFNKNGAIAIELKKI